MRGISSAAATFPLHDGGLQRAGQDLVPLLQRVARPTDAQPAALVGASGSSRWGGASSSPSRAILRPVRWEGDDRWQGHPAAEPVLHLRVGLVQQEPVLFAINIFSFLFFYVLKSTCLLLCTTRFALRCMRRHHNVKRVVHHAKACAPRGNFTFPPRWPTCMALSTRSTTLQTTVVQRCLKH
jgi:hypothetical protein